MCSESEFTVSVSLHSNDNACCSSLIIRFSSEYHICCPLMTTLSIMWDGNNFPLLYILHTISCNVLCCSFGLYMLDILVLRAVVHVETSWSERCACHQTEWIFQQAMRALSHLRQHNSICSGKPLHTIPANCCTSLTNYVAAVVLVLGGWSVVHL